MNNSNQNLYFLYLYSLGPSFSAFFVLAADRTVNVGAGIRFNNTTTSYVQALLNYYETYSATVSLSGVWAAPITTTLRLCRIGNMVQLQIDAIGTATGTTAAKIGITAGSIPTRFLPTTFGTGTYLTFTVAVNNNSVNLSQGCLQIVNDGSMIISITAVSSAVVTYLNNFTGSGNTGFITDLNASWLIS